MAGKNRIYKWYLIMVIIYSSLTLISSISFFVPELLPFAFVQGFIGIFWYIFTIVMLIIMLVKKIEKAALWIPMLYLIDLVLSLGLGIAMAINMTSKSMDITTTLQNPIIGMLSAIFPVIILVIAIKLILRK